MVSIFVRTERGRLALVRILIEAGLIDYARAKQVYDAPVPVQSRFQTRK